MCSQMFVIILSIRTKDEARKMIDEKNTGWFDVHFFLFYAVRTISHTHNEG